MEATNQEREVAQRDRTDDSLQPGTTTGLAQASPRAVRAALNRLIVTGRGEMLVLAAAARIVDGAERRERLHAQIERRVIFLHDLQAAVTRLGGVAATRAPGAVSLAVGLRRFRQLFIGPHEGDAYAACARATEQASSAYARALTLRLPHDVRFGVERQDAEVEWDRGELRRLRWGAPLTPLPNRSVEERIERAAASASNEAADARALEVWSEEGGPAPGGSRGTNARAPVA